MTEIRIVPDPLVFPNPEPAFRPLSLFVVGDGGGAYAPEKMIAVTPGQVIHVTIGHTGNSFDWIVPKGVIKIRVEAFGP